MRKLLALLATLSLLALLGSCASDGGSAGDGGTGVSTAPASTTATTEPGSGPVEVKVYFGRSEMVATAGRSVAGPEVGRGAVEALLAGPEGIETEIGMRSEIPAATELLGLDITGGVATVDLSGAFESGGGSLSMQLRVAQVVFTLTQFDTVDTVRFRIDGQPVVAIGGEGVMVDGVDRSDFAAVTPSVLVESPVPGQVVSSPLEITGMANTFEATVNYEVSDPTGVVDQGFTTATAGNGTFGTFAVTSTFEVTGPGAGSVVGFEISARDGSRLHPYEVPVQVE